MLQVNHDGGAPVEIVVDGDGACMLTRHEIVQAGVGQAAVQKLVMNH